jgi:hypothetical protein
MRLAPRLLGGKGRDRPIFIYFFAWFDGKEQTHNFYLTIDRPIIFFIFFFSNSFKATKEAKAGELSLPFLSLLSLYPLV